MAENWRTEVDAHDHFLHQKKRVELEARRPSIRRASDLVGPGIGASAVRITDFNDLLATYDGFYSALDGALNQPPETGPFIGFTVMDDVLGGAQVFTALVSGNEYKRIFLRNPSDPASISFGVWKHTNVPAEEMPAPFVPEMGYVERTTNWTTTNTSLYNTASTALVAGLALDVVGEGKPVELVFDGNLAHSATTATSLAAYFVINGSATVNPGGALGFVAVSSGQRYLHLSRRVVLGDGVSYNIRVGVYAQGAGTTTLTGYTTYPSSLRVNRLA